MKFCKVCGQGLDDNVQICPKCGTSQSEAPLSGVSLVKDIDRNNEAQGAPQGQSAPQGQAAPQGQPIPQAAPQGQPMPQGAPQGQGAAQGQPMSQGAPQGQAAPQGQPIPQGVPQGQGTPNAQQFVPGQHYANPYMYDPTDHTFEMDRKDIDDNKTLAVAVYVLGWMGIIVALLAAKESKFVGFHVRQMLKLEILYTLIAIISLILCWTFIVPVVAAILCIVLVVVQIIGFVNTCRGRAKEIPLINGLKFL